MQVASLRPRIPELVAELAEFHGHRTLWVDPRGQLCHSEPEDVLEDEGYIHVLTALRPSEEELLQALARLVTPAASTVAAAPRWPAAQASAPVGLVPA